MGVVQSGTLVAPCGRSAAFPLLHLSPSLAALGHLPRWGLNLSSRCCAHRRSGKYKKITGLDKIDKVINIDQSPIGRTPRSNPATYIGLWDDIRALFAEWGAKGPRGTASALVRLVNAQTSTWMQETLAAARGRCFQNLGPPLDLWLTWSLSTLRTTRANTPPSAAGDGSTGSGDGSLVQRPGSLSSSRPEW